MGWKVGGLPKYVLFVSTQNTFSGSTITVRGQNNVVVVVGAVAVVVVVGGTRASHQQQHNIVATTKNSTSAHHREPLMPPPASPPTMQVRAHHACDGCCREMYSRPAAAALGHIIPAVGEREWMIASVVRAAKVSGGGDNILWAWRRCGRFFGGFACANSYQITPNATDNALVVFAAAGCWFYPFSIVFR